MPVKNPPLFWPREMLDAAAISVPRHGVRALLLTPDTGLPQLVGTDLHLTAPVDGRLSDSFDPVSGSLSLRSAPLPAHRGELWLTVPAGWRLGEGRPPEIVGERRWEHGVVLLVDAPSPWEFNLRFKRAPC